MKYIKVIETYGPWKNHDAQLQEQNQFKFDTQKKWSVISFLTVTGWGKCKQFIYLLSENGNGIYN